MTYDEAAKLVDLITGIAMDEIERKALDADHWEQADDLTHRSYKKRSEAIDILMTVKVSL